MKLKQKLFATTAKGVEPVLAEELRRMGAADVVEEPGGASFSGDIHFVYRANLWLRTANRVLMSIAQFDCQTEDDLYREVRKIDWQKYLTNGMTFAVDANTRNSTITHSKYAALKIKDAVADKMRMVKGSRPNVNPKDPDLRINAHIVNDVCTLSLDSSGESLDKRGYRIETVQAPMRETLAAALVEFTGWTGQTPFVDPMCGSGTIVIEAAMKAANIAPGMVRKKFGFQRWVGFNKSSWDNLISEAESLMNHDVAATILGCDVSVKALRAAIANAKAAGVGSFAAFKQGDIMDFTPPPEPGVIIVNPPYGERIGSKENLEILYKTLGDIFKQRCSGYTAYIFTGDLDLAKRVGLKASRRIPLYNGPIESRLLKYELY